MHVGLKADKLKSNVLLLTFGSLFCYHSQNFAQLFLLWGRKFVENAI